MRWLFTGKGMLTYSPSIVAASVKVLEESATPDVQVTFAPGSFKGGQIGELEETPGLSAGSWQMRPLSRGYVEAKSNRPGDMPAINPRYLSEESDRRAIIGGLRFARRIFAAPALKQFVRDACDLIPFAGVVVLKEHAAAGHNARSRFGEGGRAAVYVVQVHLSPEVLLAVL